MNIYLNKIFVGDYLRVMNLFPSALVNTVVTSPPYWGLGGNLCVFTLLDL